jgi:hypothetical protein
MRGTSPRDPDRRRSRSDLPPIPVSGIVQIVRCHGKIESPKPETARTAACKLPYVAAPDASGKVPVFPRTIQVIVRIVAPTVMPHPLIVRVDVGEPPGVPAGRESCDSPPRRSQLCGVLPVELRTRGYPVRGYPVRDSREPPPAPRPDVVLLHPPERVALAQVHGMEYVRRRIRPFARRPDSLGVVVQKPAGRPAGLPR